MNLFEFLFPTGWVGASPSRLGMAVGITLGFTVLARVLRGVSPSGAVAGGAICLLLFVATGPVAFTALASVFVLAWMSTRAGYSRKQKLGTAEKRDGRTASQVMANLAVAAGCALLYGLSGQKSFLAALAAALAEPAADTVSSEFGQSRSDSARLVTTGRSVPAGTNGGVTAWGTLAGCAAAFLVAMVCVIGGLIPQPALWIASFAGVLGMFVDSYLGALLEGRTLNNDAVNFLGTLFAAVTGGVMWQLLVRR